MAKLPSLKRIMKEDFPPDDQPLVEKIGYPFNTAIEAILQALNKGLTFENLTWQYKELTIQVRADGTFGTDASFKIETKGKPLGISIIYVANQTSPSTTLTTPPFAQYTTDESLIKINNITGLQAGNKYLVRLIVYS